MVTSLKLSTLSTFLIVPQSEAQERESEAQSEAQSVAQEINYLKSTLCC